MTIFLKQSTASQEVLLPRMVDSTDGNTQKTALTIANTDIKIWSNGGTTQASKTSGGATHISNGDYYCVLDATDTATLGPLVITCHPTGALYTRVECVVLSANVFDSLIGGGDLLDASVVQWTGTNVATPDTAGYPKVTHKAGTGTGELNITSGVVDANATKWNGTAVSTPDTAGQPKVTVAAGVGTGQLSLTAGVIAATVAGAVGSVTGAVGSVTGAVGSVTGAVGSVTGNVGGNVVGSVGSVTGAVGSVTGAVGSVTGAVASVTGAVGSVTGAVTVGTNNDKTGYALTTAGIDAILDRPIAEPVGAFSWGAASLRTIIQWLGVLGRNKNTQTATTHLVRNDADSGTLGTAAVSDDGTTFIHGKYS